MSEQNQITVFVILAFIGAVTSLIFGIKFMFWILLYSMIHPVHALIALIIGGLFYYAVTKE